MPLIMEEFAVIRRYAKEFSDISTHPAGALRVRLRGRRYSSISSEVGFAKTPLRTLAMNSDDESLYVIVIIACMRPNSSSAVIANNCLL